MIIKPTGYNRLQEMYSVLGAVSEALATANEPLLLMNTVIDTLTEVLSVECCWIQLLDFKSQCLTLVAQHGFTPEMALETESVGLEQGLGYQAAGLGNRLFIPDLSRDSEYGLSAFVAAGLRSLVAVPLMTYRVQGILGVASSSKRQLSKGTIDLLSLIAGMVGMALDKAELYQRSLAKEGGTEVVSDIVTGESQSKNEPRPDFEHRAEVMDSTIALTPIEKKLLRCLMNNDGQVLTYDDLVAKVWGDTRRDLRAHLRTHIQHLKHRLHVAGNASMLIVEISGAGYRLINLSREDSLDEEAWF